MNKKYLLLGLSALLLAGCASNPTSSSASSTPVSTASSVSSSSSSSSVSSSTISSTSVSSSTVSSSTVIQKNALEAFKEAAEAKNYTLDIIDYGGNNQQFYLEDAFYYQFIGELTINGYIQDDYGVYSVAVSSTGRVTGGYYYLDDDGEPLKQIYPDLTSLASISFDESLYTESEGIYILKDLTGNEARRIFEVVGYDPDSEYSGMNLTDVDEIDLYINDYGRPSIDIVFNDRTSGRGTTVAQIVNVGKTELAVEIQEAYKSGTLFGKKRIDINDVFYDYMGELKRAKNYTLHVESLYTSDTWQNYTTDSYFTQNAFYSVSSRSTDEDLGYVNKDGKVHLLSYDEIRDNYLVGDLFKDSSSNTYDDVYELINSFSDLSWDPYTLEVRKDGDKYIIEDSDFIVTTFYMLNETMLRFYLVNIEFYKEGDKYNFMLNLYDGQQIKFDVTNVGTTKLGNY